MDFVDLALKLTQIVVIPLALVAWRWGASLSSRVAYVEKDMEVLKSTIDRLPTTRDIEAIRTDLVALRGQVERLADGQVRVERTLSIIVEKGLNTVFREG
jgi:hypothetical protein